MYVLAFLHCESCDARTDHEIDTRSREACCTTCQTDHSISSADLNTLLEGS